MRAVLVDDIEKNHLSVKWLFECEGNYWTFADPYPYNGNTYRSQIVTETFSGITEHLCKPVDNLIPPNEGWFSLAGEKTDFSAPSFVGKPLTIRKLIDGVEKAVWGFDVKSCYYSYGRFNFTCEDFLQPFISSDKEFPNTALINGLDSSDIEYAGDDKACVPVVFGTAFAPLRPILVDGVHYHVLGPDSGVYTINKVASPVEFEIKSEYLATSFDFTLSLWNGLRLFTNNITASGGNGVFNKSGKLLDMPTQFSNSETVSMTCPADVLSNVFQKLGVPIEKIDIAGTFATAKTAYSAGGFVFNKAYTTRKEAKKVICEILAATNSIIRVTDKIELVMLSDSAVIATLTREHIKGLSFSPKTYSEAFDAGTAQYYPGIQAGTPIDIEIPIDGDSYTNISSDKILIPCLTDTQLIQKVAIIFFKRKYRQSGTINFSSNHGLLHLQPGDKVEIADDLYEDYQNVYVDSVTINPNLSLKLSFSVFSDAIGDLSTYSPAVYTPVESTPDIITDGGVISGNDVTVTNGAVLKIESVLEIKSDGKLKIGSGSDLDIESGGKINIKATDGICVESGGGIKVESGGGVEINSGGKIVMNTIGSAASEIKFTDSGVDFANIKVSTDSQYGRALFLGVPSKSLVCVDGTNIALSSSSLSELRAGTYIGNDNNARVLLQNSSNNYIAGLIAKYTNANLANGVYVSAGNSQNFILQAVGNHSIQMVGGLEIHKGMLVMGYDSATYDSLIGSTVGDCIEFSYTDGRRVRRYRNGAGTISRSVL